MKKFLAVLCSVFLLTGCSEKAVESSVSESIPEITTEPTTEAVTEISGIYEQLTYREVLDNIYYNCEFPDWDYKNYSEDVTLEFSVYDIDGDGREELLVRFDNRSIYVYDHNADGNIVRQFAGYFRSDFYENGALKVYSAHNQTHSFEVHPFQMYSYNAETDSYDRCGSVYGIDKDIVDMINKEKEEVGSTDFLEYPSEYDTSSSGTVYYIRSDDDTEVPMDMAEYNEYCSQFTENTDVIDIPFMELTKENIKKVSGNSLNVIEISDNITFYDLTVPENAEYRPKNRVIGQSYDMSGYGTIREQDGNIYLENLSKERTALIELPVESETVYVIISCIIDDSRFAYSIIQEDFSLGCGVYNLENGEDFRIESKDRCHYFPQYIAGDYLILKRGFIADVYGYSRLNLDTFEMTDVDSKHIPQEQRIPKVAFSPDGKTGAVYSGRDKNGEYVITLFSLNDDTKVAEYKFSSENEYTSFSLEFKSKYELYVYPYKEVVAGSDYLYKINVPPIPVLNDWQKAYKQELFDFMDSDDYFTGSDIIEPSAFSLYDLNTDGTPELIISENTSHAGSCHIYTYDGELIYLGKYGAYGGMGCYEDNGTICTYNIGQGIEHEGFFRLENNEINMLAMFYNDVGYRGKEQATFKCNDTEVTEDEYNAKLAEYRGIEYVSLGRDYSFEEIDTALNEYSRIISVSRASELLWLNLPESDNRHISYYNRQKFDSRTYYIFRSYEDYDDRQVTTGWYAVDIFTGDCYNTNTLTELTPLINEEKKFSYEVTDSGIEIYSDGEFYQSIDVEIDDTFLDRRGKDLVKFRDYNFDGYNDIAVETALATNAVFSYFRYNPDTEYFESWEELDNLHFYIKINEDKTLAVHAKSGAVDADDTVYKWAGDVLVPVSAEKRYIKGKDIFMDYLEYDDNGDEILVKREKYILDENGNTTGTVDVTP
ncbi:MAG: hypothetical protein NC340_07055 [Ruminococcus flavefaciens]|nr:hypothetical protein [Ruminococcus flavefaciens]MCM1229515.1 hypothetical protein [Ruminococcus flavefaciens]